MQVYRRVMLGFAVVVVVMLAAGCGSAVSETERQGGTPPTAPPPTAPPSAVVVTVTVAPSAIPPTPTSPVAEPTATVTAAPAIGTARGGGAGGAAAKLASPTLQDELFIAGFLGGGGGGADCASLAYQHHDLEWVAFYGYGQLCVYGLPLDEPAYYDVFDAAGARVASGVMKPERVEGEANTATIDLVSKTYAAGVWTVLIKARSVDKALVFDVTEEDTAPWFEMRVSSGANAALDVSGELSPGDTVGVHGLYAPPNAPLSLGVYKVVGEKEDKEQLKLVRTFALQSDEWGRVHAKVPITDEFDPGQYCLVLAVRPGYDPSDQHPYSVGGAYQWIQVK